MRPGGKADTALQFTDANDAGGSIFIPPTDFTGMNEPAEKLRTGVRARAAARGEDGGMKLYGGLYPRFGPIESGNIAAKAIRRETRCRRCTRCPRVVRQGSRPATRPAS